MGVLTRKLRWYSIILYLVGSIISLVDPVTDILTVSKFYHAGHKTWFGVGLLFIILPSLLLPMVQLFYSASPQSCYLLYSHEIGKIRQLSFFVQLSSLLRRLGKLSSTYPLLEEL